MTETGTRNQKLKLRYHPEAIRALKVLEMTGDEGHHKGEYGQARCRLVLCLGVSRRKMQLAARDRGRSMA